jgi:hypothetical protein
MVLAAPGPLLTPPPSSSSPKTPTGPTPPKFDPRMKKRTIPPKPYLNGVDSEVGGDDDDAF